MPRGGDGGDDSNSNNDDGWDSDGRRCGCGLRIEMGRVLSEGHSRPERAVRDRVSCAGWPVSAACDVRRGEGARAAAYGQRPRWQWEGEVCTGSRGRDDGGSGGCRERACWLVVRRSAADLLSLAREWRCQAALSSSPTFSHHGCWEARFPMVYLHSSRCAVKEASVPAASSSACCHPFARPSYRPGKEQLAHT
jgi:hypothetical protein